MPFEPESLTSQCLARFANLLLFEAAWNVGKAQEHAFFEQLGTFVPERVSNALIACLSKRKRAHRAVLSMFSNPKLCRVTRAHLFVPPGERVNQDGDVLPPDFQDSAINALKNHPLVEIDLSFRTHETDWSLSSLVERSQTTLKRLAMINCTRYVDFSAIGSFVHLRSLNLCRCIHLNDDALVQVTTNLAQLAELDVSFCERLSTLAGLAGLRSTLLSLNVRCVPFDVDDALVVVLSLDRLRHLDVSWSPPPWLPATPSMRRGEIVPRIVERLVDLTSLDVSFAQFDNDSVASLSSLAQPLQFLGLVGVEGLPSATWSAPLASTITGESSIEQVCAGLERYQLVDSVVKHLVRESYSKVSSEDVEDGMRARLLSAIVKALVIHGGDPGTMVSGTATMFHLFKTRFFESQDCVTIHESVKLLIECLETRRSNVQLAKNCLITLCQVMDKVKTEQFRKRLGDVCADCIREPPDGNESVVRLAVYAVYNLGCSTTKEQKRHMLKSGTVKTIIAFVDAKTKSKEMDDIMEVACGFLWNITDECPPNCEEFIELGGMKLFQKICEENPDSWKIIKNLLGLLGNVSEVSHLHKDFMETGLIRFLTDCVKIDEEGIEISYNSTGILCNIVTNRDLNWTVTIPKEEVLETIRKAVLSWNLSSQRSINYNSLTPLLNVARSDYCPVAQLWAVWALANLCSVSEKYSPMMKKEGGLNVLADLLADPRVLPTVKKFADVAQTVCLRNLELEENEEQKQV